MANWKPTSKELNQSNLSKKMKEKGFETFRDFWQWSINDKTAFWEDTVQTLGIQFAAPYKTVLDVSMGVDKAIWFPTEQFNIVDSCFQNASSATAIIYQNSNGELVNVSQEQLLLLVNKLANAMVAFDLQPKDVIAIYLPMNIEAVAIYLAAIKAGLTVATIADSFSEEEIAVRVALTNPKMLFTQDALMRSGKEIGLYEKCKSLENVAIVVKNEVHQSVKLHPNDLLWDAFISDNTEFTSVKMDSSNYTTILFSSGTTGTPKAIPWTHITPLKCAMDGYYHHDIQKGNVVCWPTNLGWMMGPWLVFATLINKGTIALSSGGPISTNFGKFVEQAKVNMLGLVPSIVKSWKQHNTITNCDWSQIKCFSSTGEVSNPEEMAFLMNLAGGRPIIEYCGGTEIGGGYIASTLIQENIPSLFSCQTLGGEFVLLNDEKNPDDQGEVFLIPPILGLSTALLHKSHYKVYYQDTPTYKNKILRKHGDAINRLKNGYYKANGRVDDTMNLGGIKIASVQLEAVINELDFIDESAAVGITPKSGGPTELVIFYVSSKNNANEQALKKIQNCIKTKLNPLFKVVDLVKIDNLPRTASKKIKRKQLRINYIK